jgi:hypothetical protein
MNEETDFEIGGRLRARRLRAVHPPRTTTDEERVRTERTDRRRHVDQELQPDKTYEELEIEKQLRGEILSEQQPVDVLCSRGAPARRSSA